MNDPPKRFAVVGSSCSGKTTFSRAIADKLRLRCIEIDAIFWLPNWQERDRIEFRNLIDEETAKESWVIDGSYTRLHDLTLRRSDVIIWLNHSFNRVFYRAFTRTIKRAITCEDLFNGCKESFYTSFCTKESILLWVMKTWKPRRNQYRIIFDRKTFGDKVYVELRSQRDVVRFLDEL